MRTVKTKLILWRGSKGYVVVRDIYDMDLDSENDCEEIIDTIRQVKRQINEDLQKSKQGHSRC